MLAVLRGLRACRCQKTLRWHEHSLHVTSFEKQSGLDARPMRMGAKQERDVVADLPRGSAEEGPANTDHAES